LGVRSAREQKGPKKKKQKAISRTALSKKFPRKKVKAARDRDSWELRSQFMKPQFL